MVTRKKTKLENFFSLKQHLRRIGASNIGKNDSEFSKLKLNIIDAEVFKYTHGSSDNLDKHMEELRKEFHQKTELEYYHAQLNVLLRRKYKLKETYKKFRQLWEKEHDFLLENLNTRWLVSASDSFLDHDKNDLCRAYAFSSLCLINTCKLYETERFLLNCEDENYLEAKISEINSERIPLFDGTSAFKLGTCDTLRNMSWRLQSLHDNTPTLKILKELFRRINKHKTAYARMANYHTNKNTIWW